MTELDKIAAEVDLPEDTEVEKQERRVSTVQKAIAYLTQMDENLLMIEKALGAILPEALNGAALGDAVDMISDLHVLYNRISGDSGSLKAVGKRITFVKEVTMPERFASDKIKNFSSDRFRVTKTSRVMASVNPESGVHPDGHPFAGQPIAWDWLREHDLGSLIKPTVNASSLSAAAKEAMENGGELPEDLFRVHTQPSVSITKLRG